MASGSSWGVDEPTVAGWMLPDGFRVRRAPVVVRWIDDRNEAARLGVSVEQLLAARKVEAALRNDNDDDGLSGHIQFEGVINVTAPRFHHQIIGFTA